jgi:hypothetical protein
MGENFKGKMQVAEQAPWDSIDRVGPLYIVAEPENAATRDSIPEERRVRAEEALASLPEPDCEIWSDGSAIAGSLRSGSKKPQSRVPGLGLASIT